MGNIVFAINEEYNSNGRTIAKMLAKELNIPYYENEIIKLASKEFNVDESIFYSLEDWNLNYMLLPFPLDFNIALPFISITDDFLPLQNKIFNFKSAIVEKIAKENCVIFCKCSNYMLIDNSNCVKILIYANDKDRINLEKLNNKDLTISKINRIIRKKDKQIAKYYSYHTMDNWDNKKMYDVLINSRLGIDKCVKFLKSIFEDI